MLAQLSQAFLQTSSPNGTGYSVFNLINYEDFDGIVVLSDLINNARVLEHERLRILKAQKPAITINKKLQGICCLKVDNYTGMYEALAHLVRMHEVKAARGANSGMHCICTM